VIAHLSYVMCDECGTPAAPAGNAAEARAEARRVGFVYKDGRDLCKEHGGHLSPEREAELAAMDEMQRQGSPQS
jgi:recombinational DNA repair protein (RecF pathway)